MVGDERHRPPNRKLLLSPRLSGPALRNGAGDGTSAFPKSNRPDGPGADERNGDGPLATIDLNAAVVWWPFGSRLVRGETSAWCEKQVPIRQRRRACFALTAGMV